MADQIRGTEGRIKAEQRRNNSLPISLRFASPLEVARIVAAIDRALRDTPSNGLPNGIEAGLVAIQLMLVTGRSLGVLHELRLASGVPSSFQSQTTAYLVRYSNGYALSLPAGRSSAENKLQPEADGKILPQDHSIILSIGERTARCLRKLLTPANWDISGPGPAIWLSDRLLFTVSLAELENSAIDFLTIASGWFQVARRRRLLTFDRIAATITEGITHIPGGGASCAGIITAQPNETRKASFYYVGWTSDDLSELHRIAVTALGIDTFDPRSELQLKGDEDRALGSRLSVIPTHVEVFRDQAITILGRDKRRRGPAPDLASVHELLLVYTWMKWAICVGGRASQWPLVHPSKIDPHTGFGLFVDKAYAPPRGSVLADPKNNADLAKAFLDYKIRLLWVPPHVYHQLKAYQRHVDHLASHADLPEQQKIQIRNWIAARSDRLPFFELANDGTVIALRPARFETILANARWQWPLPMNALRHYTASRLRALVPSEISSALMGHWDVGAEPWCNSSALDPMMYRAHLERAFEALLPEAEWPVLHGLQDK